jgi:2-C-methyl-D-erythritol 2,4-cyclodiphosphate synthase
MDVRIGQGIDAHRFGEGDHVTLGGVRIAHDKGLIAHSDGDVIIHALCDAILGALGLGDIGHHFPDTDPNYKGADSRVLLRHVVALMRERKLQVGNVDITVVAQAPRIATHIDDMQFNLSDDLGAKLSHVNIKATTMEGMGFTGRKEGIAAFAVVLLLGA